METKKVLFVATVVKKHINVFHLPYLRWFQEVGYETHVAARDDFNEEECYIPYCNKYYNIEFERSPLKINNYNSYRKLKKIINNNQYQIIHCHTPVAALLTRLAARKARKKGTKVIYTAHGFHFFKGAPLINWLLYFPIEWICSIFTDNLITINKEDYHLSKKLMKPSKVHYVPGVGIDFKKLNNISIDISSKRDELCIPKNGVILLSVGELSKRKNHEVIIEAVAKLNQPNVHYCIAGQGDLEGYLKSKAKLLNIENQIHFLGFRSDIAELCKMADIFLFPSLQEGLPVSLMEAMSLGIPIICSNVRGNSDLISSSGGVLCNPTSSVEFCLAIKSLINDSKKMEEMIKYNKIFIQNYDISLIHKKMKEIYLS